MLRIPTFALLLAALLTVAASALAQMSEEDRAKRWFLEHDRNHDGYVTVDEALAYEAKVFHRMDVKRHNRLMQDEFCAGIPTVQTGEADRCHLLFAKIDASGDAYITLEEDQSYYRTLLENADKDQDGKVSLEEFLAATQAP